MNNRNGSFRFPGPPRRPTGPTPLRTPGGGSRGPGLPTGTGWRPSPATRRSLIAAAVIVALGIALLVTASFWVNWWWFGSIGHRDVLVTRYVARGVSFLAGGALAALFLGGNVAWALRRTRPQGGSGPSAARPWLLPRVVDRFALPALLAGSALAFLVWGSAAAARWESWWLFFAGGSFGVEDPTFGRDAGFYVFALPALRLLRAALFSLLFVTALAVAATYLLRLGLDPRAYRQIPVRARAHVLGLVAGLLVVQAGGYLLANYGLVYSTRGVVFGVGYTDANAQRWANWILAGITLLAAAFLVADLPVRRWRLLAGTAVAWAVLSFLLGVVYPAAVQRTVVEPSELRRERPFIEDNLAMTRRAWALDEVDVRELSGQGTLTADALAAQPATVANIRLWDYRIIRQTYQQLQTFVPFYVFNDVDVDRYPVEGGVQQVLISARELNVGGLPSNAQTWTNRHLAYTHGYGVVVSPVAAVGADYLPVYSVGYIPPSGTGALAIERPQIYFGEVPAEWVIVGTEQEEFDGLAGEGEGQNYAGAARGSVGLGNVFARAITATYLRDRNVFISGQVTGESRVLLRRGVVERAEAVAPFLTYDPDPYIVIADGRLLWVLDAYTTTDRFPNAQPARGLNYVRNSVKVVVDAYDGTTTFYRTDTPDPIADAYGDIYGDLFTPIAQAPPTLAAHFRYPEFLYRLQTEVYATHHVAEARAYYDGDDRWTVAQEQVEGRVQPMEPYYVTLPLPGEADAEFTLIRPFTPGGQQERQNMTAWMAARAEPDGTSRLVVYRFPRQATVLGPRQIEASIDQTPEISEQLTLLDQAGSRVIRGNLLVIPVGEALLYVQPVYLQATESEAAYPELRFVIAASGGRAVMRTTLAQALADVTAPRDADPPPGQAPTDGPALPPPPEAGAPAEGGSDLAAQALAAYERGQAALARGDWAAYGQEQATLEALLRALAVPGATPVP